MGARDVLIVDDDPDIRAMLAFILSSEFTVRLASGGAEAIEELREDAPAAMLLDVNMPGIDGYGVLLARRDEHLAPDTYVVMLSCQSAESDLVRSWSLGADAYLPKPTDPEVIASQLRAHLATADR